MTKSYYAYISFSDDKIGDVEVYEKKLKKEEAKEREVVLFAFGRGKPFLKRLDMACNIDKTNQRYVLQLRERFFYSFMEWYRIAFPEYLFHPIRQPLDLAVCIQERKRK